MDPVDECLHRLGGRLGVVELRLLPRRLPEQVFLVKGGIRREALVELRGHDVSILIQDVVDVGDVQRHPALDLLERDAEDKGQLLLGSRVAARDAVALEGSLYVDGLLVDGDLVDGQLSLGPEGGEAQRELEVGRRGDESRNGLVEAGDVMGQVTPQVDLVWSQHLAALLRLEASREEATGDGNLERGSRMLAPVRPLLGGFLWSGPRRAAFHVVRERREGLA